MDSNNKKKNDQLGMPYGTANNKLRKDVLFALLKRHNENVCFQCGETIDSVDDLSLEHKTPWLDSDDPPSLFFNIDNIAFSHLHCNIGARRHIESGHGTYNRYDKYGCRCKECKAANASNRRNWRHNRTMRL
jgi:hypothetical protein